MKRLFLALPVVLGAAFPAVAEEMPVDRVILSTSGLANFVHSGVATGNVNAEFPVRLEQVDDILKSLVVFDRKGRLGGVTLPGKKPLDQVFKDMPFTRAQMDNPALLLNAYQGSAVTVKAAAGKSVSGKLLRVVAERTVDDKKEMTRNRVSLMTETGLQQVILEDLQSVQFDDVKIRAEIARALDAIRENGRADRRLLTVALLGGGGPRDVSLSYVVDAPVWKTSYRMVVPAAGNESGLLQGWAVIENMTASDWKSVDLTLVSGNPVTFRQALYTSYYVDRPEIPVQVFGRVMPRVDQGAATTASHAEMDAAPEAPMRGGRAMKASPAPAMMAASPAMEMQMMAGDMAMNESFAVAGSAAGFGGRDDVAAAAIVAQSSETATQVLFRFPDRFSLKSGQSMMVPFLSRDVPMERVSLYQPDTHPKHPLAAVELKNDGETGLPPGILTLYEENALLKGAGFVGDAQLPLLAQGEKRMVSYALDSKVDVARDDKSTTTAGKMTISKGVMRTAVKTRMETVYTIKTAEKEPRTLVIEHPKHGDFKLVAPDPKEAEVTDTHYRLRLALAGGETKVFPVVLEREDWQSVAIGGFSTDQILSFPAQGDLPQAVKDEFARLAELRRAIDDVDIRIQEAEQKKQIIFEDQVRVRENLKSLSGKSDARDKYLEKLSAQEEDIARLDSLREKLARERQEKQAEFDQAIAKIEM